MKVAIISGSVYGTAEEVARHAETLLKAAGLRPGMRHVPPSMTLKVLPPMPCLP